METVDLLLRACAFALALAAAIAIVLRGRGSILAMHVAALTGGIAAFVAASAPGAHAALGPAAFALNAWCLATPFMAWLLARRAFGEVLPGRLEWSGALVVVALTFAADYGRFALGPLWRLPEISQGLLVAGRSVALLALAGALALALRHWRQDLEEPRRMLRAVFVVAIVAVFAVAAGTQVWGAGPTPLPWLVAAHAALVALALAILLATSQGLLDGLVAPAPRVAGVPALAVVRAGTSEPQLARRVTEAMQARRLWKREGLGIAQLAQELGTQEYLLRRAINRDLGYRNFNEFLHDYRLAEASRRLRDPAEARLPVLSIALDCGYGSIGPFNRAFKARFGVTPTQYRALAETEVAADSGIGTG